MEMKLYQTKDSENVINKDITLQDTITIKLKSTVDVITPVIVLQDNNMFYLKNCNYVWLSDFDRFYFVRGITNRNENTWELQLECDVLESFKTDILNSNSEIMLPVHEGDYMNISDDADIRKTSTLYKSNVDIGNEKTMILATIGGG